MRRLAVLLLAVVCWSVAPAVRAQSSAAPTDPLALLSSWVGGQWVGEVGPEGRKLRLIRIYAWSFDRRLLIGRSYAEADGKRVQTRETIFFWNPATARIEFTDFLDQGGGFGAGFIEHRDGRIAMEARIVGNPAHPSWRAWLEEMPNTQVIRVEALKDGKWADFGTFAYRREP